MHNLKLYKSSAGSGKTYTLVKEFLLICLPYPERFRYLAAITFTNAAAAEMKERIISALQALIEGNGGNMGQDLLAEGLNEKDIHNASQLLENILYNYSQFNIGTIDSFFYKILRAFAKELDLPLDFDLFLDTQDALQEAVDDFIHNSHSMADQHKILQQFIAQKIDGGSSWKIRSDLLRIARELLKEQKYLDNTIDLQNINAFINTLQEMIYRFEKAMDELGREAIHQMLMNGFEVEDFKYGKSGAANHFNKILKSQKEYEPGQRFLSCLENSEDWVVKNAPRRAECIHLARECFIPIGNQIIALYEEDYSLYATAVAVLKNIYTFAVYQELNRSLENYCQKENVVLISDFTQILYRHLFSEELSFIYAKVGNRYSHFLIDEFQDTSRMQWNCLKPLVENAISQGNSCLIAGDAKQSIYRWRGGDIELIEKTVEEQDFPLHSQKYILGKNFRSAPTIVLFNNQFFKALSSRLPMSDTLFQDAWQEAGSRRSGGYVQIELLDKKEYGRKELFINQSCIRLITFISQCMADGLQYADIAILVRTTDEARQAAQALLSENIPFITKDSLYLDRSPCIRLLFSLLNYLSDIRNEAALNEALFLYLSYTMPHAADSQPYTDIFLDAKKEEHLLLQAFPDKFTQNIDSLRLLPIDSLAMQLLKIFQLNSSTDAYIGRFQEIILEYTTTEGYSIQGFLDWYKNDKYTIILPEEQQSVQIMTIHKAKGLEFPVVIIPFVNWAFKSNYSDIIWAKTEVAPFSAFSYLPLNAGPRLKKTYYADAEQEEEKWIMTDNLNLLYVALTRAISRLYIISQMEDKTSENFNNIAQLISEGLKTMQNGAINASYSFGKR